MTYSCPQGIAGDRAQMRAQVTAVQSQVGTASEEAQGKEAYFAVSPTPLGIKKPTFFGYSRLFTSEAPLSLKTATQHAGKHSDFRIGSFRFEILPGCFVAE